MHAFRCWSSDTLPTALWLIASTLLEHVFQESTCNIRSIWNNIPTCVIVGQHLNWMMFGFCHRYLQNPYTASLGSFELVSNLITAFYNLFFADQPWYVPMKPHGSYMRSPCDLPHSTVNAVWESVMSLTSSGNLVSFPPSPFMFANNMPLALVDLDLAMEGHQSAFVWSLAMFPDY